MDCTKFSLSIKYVFHFTNSSNTALKSPQICHALPAIYLLMAAEFSTPYIAGTVQNTCCVYIHVQNTCCVYSIPLPYTQVIHVTLLYLKSLFLYAQTSFLILIIFIHPLMCIYTQLYILYIYRFKATESNIIIYTFYTIFILILFSLNISFFQVSSLLS